jgi:hypothetical protein
MSETQTAFFTLVPLLLGITFGIPSCTLVDGTETVDRGAQAMLATPTFVQQASASPQSPQSTVSVAYSAQKAGNANIIAIGWNDTNASITSVVDSSGNSYAEAVPTFRGNGLSQSIYYARNIKGGAGNSVTVKFSAPASSVDLRITEYSGLDVTDPFVAGGSATGVGRNASSGAIVTTSANALLFGAGMTATTFRGAGSGYTSRVITNPDGDIIEDRVATTAGSYSARAPLRSGAWVFQIAAFKASSGTPSDTVAPSVPGSLVASAASSSQVDLSWNASTDNVGVTGYKLYRNGSFIATATGTSYSDTGLAAATTYTYQVSAIDAAGNESGKSNSVSATTSGGGTVAPGFYVATNGSDTNPGTLAQPFATLSKAQAAMRASASIKTTYVRAGTYKPAVTGGDCHWGSSAGSSIGLSSADNGETWSYYPPDGYGSAILEGQSTVGNSGGSGGNGTGCAFGASNVSNVTIVGLQFQNYLYSAFWGFASTNVTLNANEIHHTRAAAWGVGAIILTASPGGVVTNNYLHDVAYNAIAIEDNSTNGASMGNTTVANNVVINSCTWPAVSGGGNDQNGGDCGAIYFWSNATSTSTNMHVTNNYVQDVNMTSLGAGDFGACCSIGIYLDDGVNNVTETGNVITGITSSCFHIHGGASNVVQGNLCDIGSSGTESILVYQADGMTQMLGNAFESNIVVAGSSGAGGGFWDLSAPNPMTIKNNAYFNYVGSSIDTTGAGSDSNPTYVNPQVSCWAPTIASGSPVFGAPVAFPGIKGGWGPPGFVIPTTGTPPSWPHGC